MISRDIIQKVVDETDIVDVITGYIPLHPKGSSMFGICPFHDDKNPSMSVSRDKKIFNCFSCSAGGNVINFVSRYENISLNQATIKLANRIGINIRLNPEDIRKERLYQAMSEASVFYQFYLINSTEGQAALSYLYKRGITDEIIEKFKIGLAGNASNYLHLALNEKKVPVLDQKELGLIKERDDGTIYDVFRARIIFPLSDHEGRIVGFSGRIYLLNDKNAKYINSQETNLFHKKDVLYNYHAASIHAKRMDKIFVFEGFMDVIAAEKAGISHAVAVMGTALTKEHVKSLTSLTKNIVLCFDGDEAGILATKRAAEVFASTRLIPYSVALPDGLDPDDYLNKYGAESLQKHLNEALSVYEYLFNEAKKDLIIDDLSSIQKFKSSVIDIIRLSRSSTIKDFFLKKMATVLNVDIQSLSQDLGTIRVVDDKPVTPLKKITKERNDYRGLIDNFKIIINLSVKSKENYELYRKNEFRSFPTELINYYRLLQHLEDYYNKHYLFDKEVFVNEYLSKNEDLIKALDDSYDVLIKEGSETVMLNDCIKKLMQIKRKQIRDLHKIHARNDDQGIVEYEKFIKQTHELNKLEE